MAQADPSIVGQLQRAILKILPYPRGWRNFREMFSKLNMRDEAKRLFYAYGDQMDEQVFNAANEYFDSEPPFQLENIMITGSHGEGTNKINFDKGEASDTDFMLILKNIKVTEEDQRHGNLILHDDSAFVNLYLTDEDLIKTWAEFLETSNEIHTERNTMLSSIKLKERFRKNYIDFGPIFTPLNEDDVKKADDGPSIEVASSIPEKGKLLNHPLVPFPTDLFDFVIAIKCEGWPLCAQEWLSRYRIWPTTDVVHNIMREGFHIVCKTSCEGSFRLSFSNTETLLIRNLTALQHKTYRTFKSFVGHYKNEWSPNIREVFCSYHLKTIVLWYCEKSDPKDWNEGTVVRHLLSLIDELIMALKEKALPMYFMPNYNLMEKMEDGKEVAEKIEATRFNLSLICNAIASEEPTIFDHLKFMFTSAVPGLHVFEKCLQKGNFELNDFFEYIDSISKELDKFWMNAAGKVPTKYDDRGKKFINALTGPLMEFLKAASKDLNKAPTRYDVRGKQAINALTGPLKGILEAVWKDWNELTQQSHRK